jgi:hypothetical protein
MSVTDRACARSAPAIIVADLNRSAKQQYFPMKNAIRSLIILATLKSAVFAQAILPTHFSGSFSVPEWIYYPTLETRVNNPDFPNGVSASFSFTINVPRPQQGIFEEYAAALDSWTPDTLKIGATSLGINDLGVDISYKDDVLQYFFIGGLLDGVNAVGEHDAGMAPSDFMFIYAPLQNSAGFFYQIDGEFAQVEGANVHAVVDITTAQPVPESSSFGIEGALILVCLVSGIKIVGRTCR